MPPLRSLITNAKVIPILSAQLTILPPTFPNYVPPKRNPQNTANTPHSPKYRQNRSYPSHPIRATAKIASMHPPQILQQMQQLQSQANMEENSLDSRIEERDVQLLSHYATPLSKTEIKPLLYYPHNSPLFALSHQFPTKVTPAPIEKLRKETV
ncbi:hypothetical protein CC80DRAFT_531721 [Byssothecium circinans]|uniref:Uncharacterized protein n=1 Tax=Byssothecium circinans TaxID=147558 RepID=A0A6A5UE09_9PLEO|nr:hypothetical protein CC80DRAFT_531721 [Byssothecium circinans]